MPPLGHGLVEDEPVLITKTNEGFRHDATQTVVDPTTGEKETIVVDTVETVPEEEREVALVVPLDADAVTDDREPTVFSELIRWITAVARAEYFPQFEARG